MHLTHRVAQFLAGCGAADHPNTVPGPGLIFNGIQWTKFWSLETDSSEEEESRHGAAASGGPWSSDGQMQAGTKLNWMVRNLSMELEDIV